MLDTPANESNLAPDEYVLLVEQRLQEARQFVAQFLPAAKAEQKKYHDRNVRFTKLQLGQTVMLRVLAQKAGSAFKPKYEGP